MSCGRHRDAELIHAKIEAVLLGLLESFLRSGDNKFGPAPSSGRNYLPKKLLRRAVRRGRKGLTMTLLAEAMERLVERGVLSFTQVQTGRSWRVEMRKPAPPAQLPEWLL